MQGSKPIERLIEKGYYDPVTRSVRAIKGRDLHVDSKDWQMGGRLECSSTS